MKLITPNPLALELRLGASAI